MTTCARLTSSRRFVLILAGVLALSLGADAPIKERDQGQETEREKGQIKKAVVPFEMLASNYMMVRAKINGKGPFRLIFDLGSPITLLSNRASEAAGVVKKDAPKSFLFSARGEASVETLEVGGLTAKGLPVIVLDHPALRALGGMAARGLPGFGDDRPLLRGLGDFFGRPLDGIIGFTFFARYKTTIDYQTKEMTFEPVDFPMRDLLKDLPDRLAGPKVARTRVLAPIGVFGLSVADPAPADRLTVAGVVVVSVLPGSPAEAAGLKAGDVLTTLDGRWTSSVADTFAAASTAAPGRAVAAAVVRGGKEVTLSVVPKDGI